VEFVLGAVMLTSVSGTVKVPGDATGVDKVTVVSDFALPFTVPSPVADGFARVSMMPFVVIGPGSGLPEVSRAWNCVGDSTALTVFFPL
jgi:hypothetical protein